MRVVFSGSRGWGKTNEEILAIYDRMADLPIEATIVHGHAPRGADAIADEAASNRGHEVERHPADWDRLGKRAGITRNVEMLDTNPDLVVCFWDGRSKGTKHMIDAARERGIPVEVITR